MNKWIEKISRNAGFTQTETKIILLIVIAFLFGLAINLYKDSRHSTRVFEYDYSVSDSLYNAAIGDIDTDDSTNVVKEEEKTFASKTELLDFVKGKSNTEANKKPKRSLGKIVNINSASIEELASLPGIGQRTAENIARYRRDVGKFKSAGDLLKIKGIGKTKLSKLSSLIRFE